MSIFLTNNPLQASYNQARRFVVIEGGMEWRIGV